MITVAVNESTYQHSHATLERGISLTDAHLKAANTLQALTDAETAARAYLLNGNATDLDAYRNSLAELDKVQRDFVPLGFVGATPTLLVVAGLLFMAVEVFLRRRSPFCDFATR